MKNYPKKDIYDAIVEASDRERQSYFKRQDWGDKLLIITEKGDIMHVDELGNIKLFRCGEEATYKHDAVYREIYSADDYIAIPRGEADGIYKRCLYRGKKERVYRNSAGYLYKVGASLGKEMYKTFYSNNGGKSFHALGRHPWFNRLESAAEYLDNYAREKKMELVEPTIL